jgi:type IV pilus assembly protein PilB
LLKNQVRATDDSCMATLGDEIAQDTLLQEAGRNGRRGKYRAKDPTNLVDAANDTSGSPRIGDLLKARGLVTHEMLSEALMAENRSGKRLGAVLVEMGMLTERSLAEILAEQSGLDLVDLAHIQVDREIGLLLPEGDAKRLAAIPIAKNGERIDVAVADPYAKDMQAMLIELLGAPVRLKVAAGSDIQQTLSWLHVRTDEIDDALRVFEQRVETRRRQNVDIEPDVTVVDENAPVVRVINLILEQAVRERASDVHIEPRDDQVVIRVRTDGALHQTMTLPPQMASPLLSRIKVMAELNIVERRRPQDGNFTTHVLGREVDVRVATSPTVFGEMVVLRLLEKGRSLMDLATLGMPAETELRYRSLIENPFGLVVCAGPTGSGKTTTLYATLAAVNDVSLKVMTIEDPVEYVIPSISQIQIHEQAGLTFAAGLRAILRQDPDIVLIGEIRDVETSRIAVQAALTGHFVMSSLHATDASAALHRFIDMGIENYLLASALTGVVGQRLLRKNCPRCTTRYEPNRQELSFLERVTGSRMPGEYQHGTGCNFCRNTGFMERVGVYEVLAVTEEIREAMIRHARQHEVRDIAMEQGMRPLVVQAVELARQGVTTLGEVFRTVAAG